MLILIRSWWFVSEDVIAGHARGKVLSLIPGSTSLLVVRLASLSLSGTVGSPISKLMAFIELVAVVKIFVDRGVVVTLRFINCGLIRCSIEIYAPNIMSTGMTSLARKTQMPVKICKDWLLKLGEQTPSTT